MTQAELIERLTDLVKQQADIIKKQADALAQVSAFCSFDEEISQVAELRRTIVDGP